MAYKKEVNFREKAKFYIPASDSDIKEMLSFIGEKSLEGLFKHIPKEYFFDAPINIEKGKRKEEVIKIMNSIAKKNKIIPHFVSDSLNTFNLPQIAYNLLSLRELTTSYTPYQPERSQGTLISLWLYQCVLSELTGFEAVNSSLYDRSTAIFEALKTAYRIKKKM